MKKDHTIFIDWGSSNVRAFLLDSEGVVVDSRHSHKGIKFVAKGEYPSTYNEVTDGWRDKSRFTLMAGMVGSANGWEEAPYIPLPASPDTIGDSIYKMRSMEDVYIVGGFSYYCAERDTYDVIRGEEVQVFGLLSKLPRGNHLFCLPGTHSKWLMVDSDNVIGSFTTVMTGDFFEAICSKTIIAMSLDQPQEASDQAFERGVRLAQTPGCLMSHIFSIRGALLFKKLPLKHVESMVSGAVIGDEIENMKQQYDTSAKIHVVAAGSLGENYARALDIFGYDYELHDGGELSLAGMKMLVGRIQEVGGEK